MKTLINQLSTQMTEMNKKLEDFDTLFTNPLKDITIPTFDEIIGYA